MSHSRPSNQMLPPGTVLGRYRVVRRLSSGGFGVVYLAVRDDGAPVAIKEFLPQSLPCRPPGSGPKVRFADLHDQARFREGMTAFFREADTLTRVRNPRVVSILDVFKDNGTAYFAMPVEKGGTLQAFIRLRTEPLPERDLVGLFIEACRGVEAIHAVGLLHLDLKPNNLWIRPDGSLVVLDLGASRWEDELIAGERLARTPGFAPPEQHGHDKKHKKLGPPTDVYGLAASLLACLIHASPTPAPERRQDVPVTLGARGLYSPELLAVVDRAMALNPARRYPSMAAFRSALERLPRLAVTPESWPTVSPALPWPTLDSVQP